MNYWQVIIVSMCVVVDSIAAPVLPRISAGVRDSYALVMTDFDQEPEIIVCTNRHASQRFGRLPRIPAQGHSDIEQGDHIRSSQAPTILCASLSCLQLLCGACCLRWLFTQSQ